MADRNDKERPDPDALLDAVNRQRKKKRGGKLYLFLGMSPGVGKTYAMLQAAQDALKEGTNVVVGVVETHGRQETEALLAGIPVIPKKKSEYRGVQLEEMDLDAILKLNPKLVLVDELAHSNTPDSRHAKRWQDVFEILDAGINVFSTLNVQHLESRKDVVGQIAGITIRETVPDSVVDRAHQIRLIDLTPADLLKRLSEGKVYLGEKAELAASNFFKEQNLTALREIALRLAAERVDTDLQTFTATREAGTPWAVTERLLVPIDHHLGSEALIRAARRLAYNLEASWIAIHIDCGELLTDTQRALLTKHLEFARSLGAEVITLANSNVVETLIRVARQKNVSQMVIRRPNPRRMTDWLTGGTLLDRLLQKSSDISIHIVQIPEITTKRSVSSREYFVFRSSFRTYLWAFSTVFGLSLFSGLIRPFLSYQSIGFLFLINLIILGPFVSLGALFFAATISMFSWDYFFIPPIGTFYIREPADIFLVITFFFSALAIGLLTRRIKKQRDILSAREDRARVLYEIVWSIATAPTKKEMLNAVGKRIGSFLGGECDIALKRRDGTLKPFDAENLKFSNQDRELAIAKWVFDNNKNAGWSTETLSSAQALYVPLKGSSSKAIGVFVFKPLPKTAFGPEDLDLLFTATRLFGLSLERELLKEQAKEAEQTKGTERLQRGVLHTLSDELRRPLAMIAQSVSELTSADRNINSNRKAVLAEHLLDATEKLSIIVDNLFAMDRLATGIFPLAKDQCSPQKLIELATQRVAQTLKGHSLKIVTQDNLPELSTDQSLAKQVLANVLINAAIYSPPTSPITIEVTAQSNKVVFVISDEGPGIPDSHLGRIFDKFYRITGSHVGGAGLGLTVAKGIVKVLDGTISAANKAEGGAVFTLSLPTL